MDISIVIPCFNIADFLKSCLESIIQNDLTKTEIIIIDDGSKDNFQQVCRGFFEVPDSYLWTDDVEFEFRGGIGELFPNKIKAFLPQGTRV